ncbi:hypothetical protein P152DRAFT_99482 [Eremomyces bilateralis CBS 781.70]|uniref:SUN domain-containing protein n=1 Tax=Eremomyces bilateralis CBS 781.70 TaxID=1392243 RepID=A0A6G1FXG0_9PEZI|nr:uncharacterized protein P152DRAFT_99482 [Eremomyces bilateralis CBS 781.70]KAF1810473.1 hypothetical protein P152DRAFT_99482 [Eremomyces bilateralis CBS 781.70]
MRQITLNIPTSANLAVITILPLETPLHFHLRLILFRVSLSATFTTGMSARPVTRSAARASIRRERTPEDQLQDELRDGLLGSQGMNSLRDRAQARPSQDETPRMETPRMETPLDPAVEEPSSSFLWRSFQTVEQPLGRNLWAAVDAIERRASRQRWISRLYAVVPVIISMLVFLVFVHSLPPPSSIASSLPSPSLPSGLFSFSLWVPFKLGGSPSQDRNRQNGLPDPTRRRLDELQARVDNIEQHNGHLDVASKKVDFLSLNLGARVDDELSSQTQARPGPPIRPSFRTLLFGPPHIRANAPASALFYWFEQGDCWCSSLDMHPEPMAQLAISPIVPFYASSVTIEHVPRSGSLDPTSAPKDLEFWIRVPDQHKWSELTRAHAALVASAPIDHKCSSVAPEGNDAKDSEFVCVGRARYNVMAEQYVQHFQLPLAEEIRRLKIETSKVVIRATSNWGQKWTCMYRVRMHGQPMEGLPMGRYPMPMV